MTLEEFSASSGFTFIGYIFLIICDNININFVCWLAHPEELNRPCCLSNKYSVRVTFSSSNSTGNNWSNSSSFNDRGNPNNELI